MLGEYRLNPKKGHETTMKQPMAAMAVAHLAGWESGKFWKVQLLKDAEQQRVFAAKQRAELLNRTAAVHCTAHKAWPANLESIASACNILVFFVSFASEWLKCHLMVFGLLSFRWPRDCEARFLCLNTAQQHIILVPRSYPQLLSALSPWKSLAKTRFHQASTVPVQNLRLNPSLSLVCS